MLRSPDVSDKSRCDILCWVIGGVESDMKIEFLLRGLKANNATLRTFVNQALVCSMKEADFLVFSLLLRAYERFIDYNATVSDFGPARSLLFSASYEDLSKGALFLPLLLTYGIKKINYTDPNILSLLPKYKPLVEMLFSDKTKFVSAFEYAIQRNLELFKCLLNTGYLEQNRRSSSGTPWAHYIIEKGHHFSFMLLKSPEIDVNEKNDGGLPALHYAIQLRNFDAVMCLLECRGCDLGVTDSDGKTAIDAMIDSERKAPDFSWAHGFINSVDDSDLLARLLNSGINVNAKNEDGLTVLHHAIQLGNLKAIELLLEISGVDLNLKDSKGLTALQYAVKQGNAEAQALLSKAIAEKRTKLRKGRVEHVPSHATESRRNPRESKTNNGIFQQPQELGE
ncbi:MAG: ankyrin repeat domain-containing protein [Holosporales bacterium]|nr:ankyrin repeat domain-containing protein [Holosporales bacterium]